MAAMHLAVTIAAASCGLLLVWIAKLYVASYRIRKGLAPVHKAPGSVPFFGHALMLAARCPWDQMTAWARDARSKKNSELVVIDFLMDSGVVLTNPDHLRHVMDKNQKNYAKDTELAYKPFMHILGTSIITSHGERWRQQRNQLSGAFRFDILESTADVAKRAVDRLSVKLETHCVAGTPVEIAEEFRIMTLEVIGELILSLSPEESRYIFPDLYLPIVTEANLRIWHPYRGYLPTPSNFHFLRTVRRLNDYVTTFIRARWQQRCEATARDGSYENKDILDRIMSVVDPASWGEDTVLDLRDQIKSFILAGHETSASMLTWTVYQLTQCPEALERVLAEGRQVFKHCVGVPVGGKDKYETSDLPTRDELNKLEYTVNALKESLRLYSVVPVVSRLPLKDDHLDGQLIPAGTKIFVNIKAVHSDPRHWPEPEKFKPERFESPFDPYTFLPFVNGPRNCLGQHLALLEARIVLNLLMQRFKFTPVNPKAGEVDPFVVPVVPRYGMELTVTRREDGGH